MIRPALLIAAVIALAGGWLPGRASAAVQVVAGAQEELRLEAGKGRLVRLSRPAATVFIAEPKIADVQVKSPTLVYVVGKAPGATSLFAIDKQEQMIANLAVNVGFDETRLRELIKAQAPNAQVQVASANDSLILTGKVSSAAEGDDVLRIASLFVQGDAKTDHIVNRLTVEASNQINLRVRIAEVSRTATEQLGVNWENAFRAGANGIVGFATGQTILGPVSNATNPLLNDPKFIRPPNDVGAIFGRFRNGDVDLNVLIDALERKELVTVLAEPNLTAVSGEPASFLAGGEFPVPVPQGLNDIVIQFKQFGVSLTFVATILDGGRISLNVRPEVSQLSTSGAITLRDIVVPALTTRRAETTVELGSGQSFAIAGLLQNNVSNDLKNLPGLADTPILGKLFRSKRFQRNESELVIIVTPYLVKPVDRRLATPVDKGISRAAVPVAVVPAPEPEKKG